MSYTPAERTILHHCTDEDGFVVTLRTMVHFDERAYRHPVRAVTEYRDAIKGSTSMDRRVAGSLNALVEQLGDLLCVLREDPHPRLDAQLIADAHAECWGLVQEVFWG